MAPSEAAGEQPPKAPPTQQPGTGVASASEPTTSEPQAKQKPNGEQNPPKQTPSGKPSGAELKKKAKEEKQARRERERQAQQTGGAGGGRRGSVAKDASGPSKGGKGANIKVSVEENKMQHKRAPSNATEAQRPVALRSGKGPTGSTSTKVAAPRKDEKQVALFGHLYGHSRRTSIAGASKDVHPAVLALGLQMSNYVVCGSNARCVASLLAFKKVSISNGLFASAELIL